MANCKKYTKVAQGHLFKHVERARGEDGNYVHFQNQNINTELSPLNYNLAPNRNKSQLDYAKERLSDVYVFNRSDVVHSYSWCITLPENFERDNPTKTSKDFFNASYEFLTKRYGEQNVLSAYVHLDETTPHMHYLAIPITQDLKRGGEKLAAKEVITRRDLKSFHMDFYKFMNIEKGLDAKVLKESTLEEGKTQEQYVSMDKFKKSKLVETVNKTIAELDDLEARKGKILTQPEIDSLKLAKSILGHFKDTPEMRDVIATAQEVDSVKEMLQSNKNILDEIKKREQIIKDIEPRAKDFADLIKSNAKKEREAIISNANREALEIMRTADKELTYNEIAKKSDFKEIIKDIEKFLEEQYPQVYKDYKIKKSKIIKIDYNIER